MTLSPQDQPSKASTTASEPLWVLVVDDDRLSSHNLSILLRFVGETPVLATSDSWPETLRMLTGSSGQTQLLAVAFGQIRKVPLVELLLNLHASAPALPLLLLGGSASELKTVLPESQMATLPQSLRAKLLMPGEGALDNQGLVGVLSQARTLSGRAQGSVPSVLISPITGAAMFRSLNGQSTVITNVRQL